MQQHKTLTVFATHKTFILQIVPFVSQNIVTEHSKLHLLVAVLSGNVPLSISLMTLKYSYSHAQNISQFQFGYCNGVYNSNYAVPKE